MEYHPLHRRFIVVGSSRENLQRNSPNGREYKEEKEEEEREKELVGKVKLIKSGSVDVHVNRAIIMQTLGSRTLPGQRETKREKRYCRECWRSAAKE